MRHLKKVLSLTLSALGVLILSGFLSLKPITEQTIPTHNFVLAHHTDQPDGCYDMILVPKPDRLLTDPSEKDAGQLDFNAFNHDYQACLESKKQSDNKLRGWVWNTNLGYISFMCKNGDNLGAACGNLIDYEVVANPNDGLGIPGRVRGFAWNDATGWISMGCDANGLNMGVACGGTQYGVKIAQVDNENGKTCVDPNDPNKTIAIKKDDLYGYGWSDAIGWINFCGSHAYLFDPPPSIITAHSRYEQSVVPVHSNGEDFYKIFVEIKEDGTLMKQQNPPAQVVLDKIEWENKLRADQIEDCGAPPLKACVYNGTTPPAAPDFTWSGNDGAFIGYLKAVAPTGAKDSIKLKYIDVKIEGVINRLEEDKFFTFDPALEVIKVRSDAAQDADSDNLLGIVGIPTNHTITLKHYFPSQNMQFKDTRVYTQLHNCSTDYSFKFLVDPDPSLNQSNGTTSEDIDPQGADAVCPSKPGQTLSDVDQGSDQGHGTPASDFVAKVDPNTGQYVRAIVAKALGKASTTTSKAFGVLARVAYTATDGITATSVRYISHIAKEGSLINQAADVRGNVRLDVQKISISGSIARTIGEAAQSKREPFYRTIKRLIKATDLLPPATVTFDNAKLNEPTSLYFYKRDKKSAPNTPCQIILKDNAALAPNNNITIIAEGCDVYIDSDIVMPAKFELGVIALEDVSVNTPRRGGNVYICADVTDISGLHIVADGGMLSYADCGNKATAINQNDGLPVFPKGAREMLKNQFTITGSIISNNTYGGSLLTPPILGDGTRLLKAEESYKARIYDINFMRYAHTITQKINGVDTECWNSKLSSQLPADCASGNRPDNPDTSIVNIRYQPPSADLPVFKEVGK